MIPPELLGLVGRSVDHGIADSLHARSYPAPSGGGGGGGGGGPWGTIANIADPFGFFGGGGIFGGGSSAPPPRGNNPGFLGSILPQMAGVGQEVGPEFAQAMQPGPYWRPPPMRAAPQSSAPNPQAGRPPPMQAYTPSTQGMMQGGFGAGRFGQQFSTSTNGTNWKPTGQSGPQQGFQQTGPNNWRR